MPVQPYTAAKRAANKRWDEAHRERKNYISARATARSFIRKKATQEDLKELLSIINEKFSND
ncbi:hypothetical protein [Levilactobacillus tujiorum]|uniref:hypothetical protein n=1 Tax=Levilactobacillus tujiorum TaxID=2912243 RepID=UPI0014570AF8|nr:hypothetical protein [Levilactobacillus tujiorum]NLR30939.1 hypothetical protein [Levilactobacillus tujiorum]